MKLTRQQTLMDYDGFVEKFKPKKTTDDCYTPPTIYAVLSEWLRANVPLAAQSDPWLRPFRPGGDYLAEDYPEGCAVVDNPPFSILGQIVKAYASAGVRFWLFAPTLTCGNYCSMPGVTVVLTDGRITYANGADVNTSFVTNMWPTDAAMVVCGGLSEAIKAENDRLRGEQRKQPAKLDYPANVTSAARLHKLSSSGLSLEIPRECCAFVRKLDCGQSVFGGGLLLSDGMAAEIEAAEAHAQEIKAARASEARRVKGCEVPLSDREWNMIAMLANPPYTYRLCKQKKPWTKTKKNLVDTNDLP